MHSPEKSGQSRPGLGHQPFSGFLRVKFFFEEPCFSMVDYLLTRADRALSPEEWSVWPRAGPSTLVWIFEGKFFLRDHPQTRAEGVLSPGNWPVWPRAGPSTLVWNFEAKIFLRVTYTCRKWGGGEQRAATSLNSFAPLSVRYPDMQKEPSLSKQHQKTLRVQKRKSFSLGDCSRVGGGVPSGGCHVMGFPLPT